MQLVRSFYKTTIHSVIPRCSVLFSYHFCKIKKNNCRRIENRITYSLIRRHLFKSLIIWLAWNSSSSSFFFTIFTPHRVLSQYLLYCYHYYWWKLLSSLCNLSLIFLDSVLDEKLVLACLSVKDSLRIIKNSFFIQNILIFEKKNKK